MSEVSCQQRLLWRFGVWKCCNVTSSANGLHFGFTVLNFWKKENNSYGENIYLIQHKQEFSIVLNGRNESRGLIGKLTRLRDARMTSWNKEIKKTTTTSMEKQINFICQCVWTLKTHSGRQNVVRTHSRWLVAYLFVSMTLWRIGFGGPSTTSRSKAFLKQRIFCVTIFRSLS